MSDENQSGVPLDGMECDELQPGPRRELIARHVETGRTIRVRCPASWTDAEIIDAIDPYRPVVEAAGEGER
jgi:hypothetical protein